MDDLDLGATIKGFIAGQKVFNRYVLIRILGRGGMGVVWLARDEELEREVALKFLPEVVALDKEAIRDLKRETRRSLELTHPHIVRIYDFIQDARTAAISMEYVAGETLAAKKVEQPGGHFEVAAIQEWARQWLDAMEYAHAQAKVAHRDLKPANLMIDGQGRLKVTDFGIAASMGDTASRVSNQFGSSGTPVYMSPQQMMGEKPAVTDDIYAIGATLYELLSGKPPFYSGNVLMQVQSKLPPSLAERRSDFGVTGESIPQEWETTIAACLAKEPKDRPQSAGEVAGRLGIAEGGLRSVPARNPNLSADGADKADAEKHATPVASAQSAVRNPKSAIFIIAAITALAAAGWYFGLHAPEQRRIESERLQVEQARMESERQQADAIRIAAEREAEARRIEAARVAAEQEAERQRLAAARGGISVRTTPSGAEVRVGAVTLDKSPLTLKDQRLGKYPVRILLAGYEDWDGEVEVKENEFAELNVPLVRSTGAVTLSSDPAGLDFTIKGEITRTGRTPAELSLPTGRYDVTFSRAGWPEQVRSVEVNRNEAVQAAGDLVGGAIDLTSTPSGAEVWSGARQVGTTPYRVAEVLPGRYDYELRLARHKPATAALTVQTRQQARENVQLEIDPMLAATQEAPFENSLGMKFVPVPGTNVLFSIWETRVQDFEAFARETGHDATAGMYSLRPVRGFREYGDTWKSPGFAQGPTHPVVGVNQADALAFCRWLTNRERNAGRLAPDQEYRLPTDAEWDAAVGKDEFPWGSQWPPPSGAGNYPGTEAKEGNWPSGWATTDGYSDGFANTAPVGSFAANKHGLHDLGGNAWEYVGDRQHGLRGASFLTSLRGYLTSAYRNTYDARRRVDMGFRVILAAGSSVQQSARETVALENLEKAAVPETGKAYTIPDLNLEILPIAPGTFQMGSVSGGDKDERPVTRVTITRPFWLGNTEVTQEQWQAVMGNNPSSYKGNSLPVWNVSWIDAMEFCGKLTERERDAGRLPAGYAYTLPTEAQWEYSCRAGTTGGYGGTGRLNDMGWYASNSDRRIQPVSTKEANAWGLHDMHGNVFEWCLDWYGGYPGGSVTDPMGPPSGLKRVSRGGIVIYIADYCRSAKRFSWSPNHISDLVGFRLALAPAP